MAFSAAAAAPAAPPPRARAAAAAMLMILLAAAAVLALAGGVPDGSAAASSAPLTPVPRRSLVEAPADEEADGAAAAAVAEVETVDEQIARVKEVLTAKQTKLRDWILGNGIDNKTVIMELQADMQVRAGQQRAPAAGADDEWGIAVERWQRRREKRGEDPGPKKHKPPPQQGCGCREAARSSRRAW